jgi:hypothetical protein
MPSGLRYTYALAIVVGGLALMFSGNAEAASLGGLAVAVARGAPLSV